MSVDLKKRVLDRIAQYERNGIDGWNEDLLGLTKEVLNYIDSLDERLSTLERVLNIKKPEGS